MTPLIAVAGRTGAPSKVSRDEVAFAGKRYLNSILRAGGEPVPGEGWRVTGRRHAVLIGLPAVGLAASVVQGATSPPQSWTKCHPRA